MNYSKVPTPHGGKEKRSTSEAKRLAMLLLMVAQKAIAVAAGATRAAAVDTNVITCGKLIGKAFSYEYYNTKFWTSLAGHEGEHCNGVPKQMHCL